MHKQSDSTFQKPTEPVDKNFAQYIVDQLETIHIDPFRYVSRETLFEALTGVKKVGEEFQNIAVQEALAFMGDAHTHVQYFEEDEFPIVVREFDGKFYIVGAGNDYKEYLGLEMVALNGVPITDITPELLKLSSQENIEITARNIARYITSNRILKYFGFSSTDQVEIETDSGNFSVEADVGEKNTKITDRLDPFDWENEDYIEGRDPLEEWIEENM